MKRKIVIASNFTIENVLPSLNAYLNKVGDYSVRVAPYSQVFQQLLDPASLFCTNLDGVNAVFVRIEDLIDGRAVGFDYGDLELAKIEENASALIECLETFGRKGIPLLLFICPRSEQTAANARLSAVIDSVERSIEIFCKSASSTFHCRTDNIAERYHLRSVDNPKGNVIGHVPYTEEFFFALGIELARKVDANFRKPFKVLVLDCDNTLWDGVCGEDGTDGIGLSEARIRLQEIAVEQSRSGMVVCLCSKNNEADVWEVFEQRREMKLTREHLVSARINWDPKSVNLRSLAEELQLGLDSFVFIDDDHAVCAEVRANCPEVLTVQLPSNTGVIPEFLDHLWVFDRLRLTAEDLERTGSYRGQVERNKVKAAAPDLSSFLASLRLQCEISECAADQIPRVSQLSLRTNQFNSTTVRYSEADIERMITADRSGIRTVRVKDRFGDYGLVGAVIFELKDTSLDVRSFMLSCRVLGRGVEYTVLREIGRLAAELERKIVNIEYLPSAKNAPILDFLTDIARRYGNGTEIDGACRISAEIAAAAQMDEGQFITVVPKKVDQSLPVNLIENGSRGSDRPDYANIAVSLARPGSGSTMDIYARVDRTKIPDTYVNASSPTEIRLGRIWEKVLRLSGIGITDDFFEVGGDSLVAVSLVVEIEEEFGVSLPLSVLIGSPTIEKLAETIDQGKPSRDWKYLVPIKPAGSLPPIFCIHAAGGNVLFYRDLASELPEDQPVYGVQARGIADKSETAHDRVEEMARAYLEEIREMQRHGPYHLCGSSFGGLVAFEAAIQLRRDGEQIETLALFDTYAPGYLTSEHVPGSASFLNRVVDRARNLANQLGEIDSAAGRITFFWSKAKKAQTRFTRRIAWKRNEFAIQYGKATGKDLPVDMMRNHKAIQAALEHYEPAIYEGSVMIFRASDQPKNAKGDTYLGWERYVAGNITTETVKGTHGALTVYPFAADLAAKFREAIYGRPVDDGAKSIAATG